MAYQEKSAWIMGIVAIVGYFGYLLLLLPQTAHVAFLEVEYVPAMLWSIGGAIFVSILLHVAVSIGTGKNRNQSDSRDKEIGRFGEYTGQAFVVIGAVGALVLALAKIDHFWIANLIYLAFVLSALLSSIAKIVGYRRGFQTW
ncbi:hypothetical protein [Psychromicrobium lacuslunae]|uniref:DUF2178 domain-containing protein n=1 Tax=Psychromicrobium lacuslunae TaxID=1618207 RepID=A0A0D4C085_9MICC|nr:hypothetical protein [Psychromicrobium lacuslunae]AJT41820.1 hypothetical protein UM93_10390 [Psychromicrobium lacuslunae]